MASGNGGFGGGGGGGVVYIPETPTDSLLEPGSYTIYVGNGTADGVAGSGQDSTITTSNTLVRSITAKGGGRALSDGGSGGGRLSGHPGSNSATQPTQPGKSGTYGFGNPGGSMPQPTQFLVQAVVVPEVLVDSLDLVARVAAVDQGNHTLTLPPGHPQQSALLAQVDSQVTETISDPLVGDTVEAAGVDMNQALNYLVHLQLEWLVVLE